MEIKAKFSIFQFRQKWADENLGPTFSTGSWYDVSLYTGWHPQDQHTGLLNIDVPKRRKWYIGYTVGPPLRGHSQDQNKCPLSQRFPFKRGRLELQFRGHYQDQNRTSRLISSKKGTESKTVQRYFCSMDILWSGTGVLWIGVFKWENSHRREFHTRMTSWLRIAITWWLRHFMSRLYEGTLQIDEIHVRFNYACATRSSLPEVVISR